MVLTGAGCARHTVRLEGHIPGTGPTLYTARAEPLSPESLACFLESADYLLLGEGHTNACDHLAQALVLLALAERGHKPVVGLEMVAQDMQPVLDRWHAERLPVDSLPTSLDWESRWGHDFELYRPIFEVCREYDLPLTALNIPGPVVTTIRKHGLQGVCGKDRTFLPDPVIPMGAKQRQALEPVLAMHDQMSRAHHPGRETFFLIQALWDTVMAKAAVGLREKSGAAIVILAGAGHVEYGWGIAARLRVFDPQARVISIMPARDKGEMTSDKADYYYLCPSVRQGRKLGLVLERRDAQLVIKAVLPDSRAAKAGLQPGDVLITAGDRDVTSGLDLHKAALTAVRNNRPCVLGVIRKGEEKQVVISLK